MTLIQLDATSHSRFSKPPYARGIESSPSGYDSELEDEEDAAYTAEGDIGDADDANMSNHSRRTKRWWHYLPLILMLVLLFAPHPSIMLVLTSYYLRIHDQPVVFVLNILTIYALAFCACCSLMVCVVRDPGAVRKESGEAAEGSSQLALSHVPRDDTLRDVANERESVTETLLTPTPVRAESEGADGKEGWCRKCDAPKPERTHHCSICGRCILKMDHHCPWIAHKCLGHWTYPAFVHYLMCITLLAVYVFIIALRIVLAAFNDIAAVDERTAFHAVFLALYSLIFALSAGSFWLWHVYLITTNQTTLECLAPFLLLRYLPKSSSEPPEAVGIAPSEDVADEMNGRINSSSDVLREHLLTSAQRRHVRIAHHFIRIYDIGWIRNWSEVFGLKGRGRWGWLERIVCGGSTCGDGKHFPRNPRSEELLARLVKELAKLR